VLLISMRRVLEKINWPLFTFIAGFILGGGMILVLWALGEVGR
jgi:hypothetical protein